MKRAMVWVSFFLLSLSCSWACAEGRVAAVVRAGLSGEDVRLAEALTLELRAAGYDTAELGFDALCDPGQLRADRFDLLVLPNAAELPANSIAPIAAYLAAGGDCIALHAPAWQRPLVNIDGKWMTLGEYRRERAGVPPEQVLFDFASAELGTWQRQAFRSDVGARHETVDSGPAPGQRALHVTLDALENWDTFASPLLESPFSGGRSVTVFSAKGGPNTTQLAIEWRERDGSRWLATVPLSLEWQRYELPPDAFRYWESVPARANDALHPETADRVIVGLAATHTGALSGRQEYWLGPLGTERLDSARVRPPADVTLPAVETLSPGYKFFDATGVTHIVPAPNQAIVTGAAIPVPAALRCMQPRPQAGGFDKGRSWRWIPLLEARTADGQWRGNPATLFIEADGPRKGAAIAAFGIDDGDWYRTRAALDAFRAVVRRMADGVFLLDAGTNYYTYFDDQTLRFGARVVNLAKTPQTGLTLRVSLNPVSGGAEIVREWPLELKPGETVVLSDSFKPDAWPDGGFQVTAELERGGAPIDTASHEAHVWRPKKETHFVSVKDGDFVLNGRRWAPHGVNYMPSSGVGAEDGKYFEQWMGARSYDPIVVLRDLEHCKDMGLNAVSIFLYRESMEAQNLLDLLRMLDARGMKANLSLRPGTPMDFRWQEIREMIAYYRLRENDTVFAFDIAWEPLFRDFEREPWHAAWERWTVERYGSVANAEKDWEFAVPRDARGAVTSPDAAQCDQDGPWNRMIAAYRRFLDTLLYDKYSHARELIRGLDARHLVSFRMSYAGDPTIRWRGCVPYDFAYLAGAVDLLEPEGYGRIGDWEQVKPGRFTFEYGRWANPKLPVMWAEAGVHAWDMGRMQATPEKLAYQAAFYERMYRMFLESGADGIFWWWYPGGFRTGENSDYGIVNCDGSDRPVSAVIRQYAREVTEPRPTPVPDTFFEMDRDAHSFGLNGIYAAVQKDFWEAAAQGRVPGLKTEATGANSADCPLVAVGNVPCTGSNPPKYLDAFFDRVEIETDDGAWQEIESNVPVSIGAQAPIHLRVKLTNLGEAKWLKSTRPYAPNGTVWIAIEGASDSPIPLPESVARFETIVVETKLTRPAGAITLRLEAAGRTPFGPPFALAFN